MRLPTQDEQLGLRKMIDVCQLSGDVPEKDVNPDIVAGSKWLLAFVELLAAGGCIEWVAGIDDEGHGCRSCIGEHQGRCSPFELFHGGRQTLPVLVDGSPADDDCPLRAGFLLLRG